MNEFIKFHALHKNIHDPGYVDYVEILKRIPTDCRNKIKQNTALPEQDTIQVEKNIRKKRTLLRHSAKIFTVLHTKER